VARTYGPSKLGSYVYYLWVATTLTGLCFLGLFSAVRKYLADYAGRKEPRIFRAVLRVCVSVELFVLTAVSLAGLLWINLTAASDERVFGSVILLSILPSGATAMATAVNESVQEIRPNVVASICSGLLYTATMLLAVLLDLGLVGLAAAYLSSRVCDCLVRWRLTWTRLPGYVLAIGDGPAALDGKPKLPEGLVREIAIFVGESSILALLTMVVWNRSETFFLKRYSAIEEVAYFSVAFGLSVMPAGIVGPFSRAAGASVYAERGREAKAGVRVALAYWRYLAFLIMPTCLGLAVMSGPLLRVLYGAKYIDAAPVLMLAAGMSMFAPLAAPATTLITAAGGQRILVKAGLVAAAITLLLDYFLVRAHAAIGGALANGLGQALCAVITIVIARRYAFAIPGVFFIRVTAAAFGMAAVVWTVIQALPDLVGIVLGPAVGAVVYCALLRALQVLDETDVERLMTVERLLPGKMQPSFRKLLRLIVRPQP
jgi:O-antigen/teichoic acid export membrane protein